MEAFSLLKYWRNGGGAVSTGATTTTAFTSDSSASKAATKTIVAAAAAAVSPYSSDGEDGPFFDLEFGVPDQESDTDEQTSEESLENDAKRLQSEDGDETESEEEASDEEEEEDGAELKFSLSSNGCMDQNAALSPSDELFFKGDLVTIEPSTILLNAAADDTSRFPVSLLKSATKFRVLLLKLKKSKSVNGEAAEISGKDETGGRSPEIVERENQGRMSGKLFVKFKVDEAPLANVLSRENSSKENHGKKAADSDLAPPPTEERRKVSNEAMNKYLKMVKPFYVRVSKRYVEKLKFPGGGPKSCAAAHPPEAAAAANAKNHPHPKQGNNLQAGLKVVRKHLGKSRSASAAAPPTKAVSDRRDDSLLQLQDGIQGAILHCKKSFNASRGTHPF